MTSKERAFLRGLANKTEAKYQIGKNGIDGNFIRLISDALEARELIKIHVLENSGYDVRTVCGELCDAVDAEPVQCIGKKFIIYRKSRENQKIDLKNLSVRE